MDIDEAWKNDQFHSFFVPTGLQNPLDQCKGKWQSAIMNGRGMLRLRRALVSSGTESWEEHGKMRDNGQTFV